MEKIHASKLLAGLVPAGKLTSDPEVALVTTDSREVKPGCIFVAFPGERFDGHDFAARALEQGAEYVVVNHPVPGVPEEKAILCPDSYHAMMVMGANYRSQYHPKMVGVTGSVGKTTTKQMTYAALCGFGETIKTEGNQNNELGMPRTLMRLESSTEYAVIEMGMSHAGEIDRLARAARPDVGIITCIGVSHIGNLGSQENICKAKLEICAGLPEGAPLVLNYDDPFLRKAKLPEHVRPVWFSLTDENADVCALSIRQETDGMSFVLEDQEEGTFVVRIPAMGRHNVANALAAYCAATRLGCDPHGVIKGLSNFEQTGRRQKVVHSKGITVIEDCYNANPDSMKAALAMFKEFPCKRRFALLGDMLELGELSREAHEELGRLAAESDLYCLVTYGENAKRTAVVAAAKGVKTLHADSYREAADALLDRIRAIEKQLEDGAWEAPVRERVVYASDAKEAAAPKPKPELPQALNEDVKAVAKDFRMIINEASPMLRTYLKKARLSAGEGNRLLIVLPDELSASAVATPEHKEEIQSLIEQKIGKKVEIDVRQMEAGRRFEDNFVDLENLINMEITVEDE